MNKAKKSFSIVMGILIISGVFIANNALGAGPGHGGFDGGPLLGVLQKIDLTDAQKQYIATNILTTTALSTLQGDVLAVAQDRAQLFKDLLTPGTSSGTINTDVSKLGSDEATLSTDLAGIWASIKTHLGSSQQAKNLQDIIAKIGTHKGRFGHHHMFGLLHKLDLTSEQKSAIHTIFSSNTSLKPDREALTSARATLLKAILSGDTSAIGTATTGDVGAVVTAQSSLANVQLTIWNQIVDTSTPVLKPAQLSTLSTIVGKIGTHITTAIDERFTELSNVMKYWNTL
jgi:Spy/CpxP family protein refolding chaperone